MIQKFPFGDSLFFRDLEILLPAKLTTTTINIVLNLAKRFPQLEISDPIALDKLREECLYTLSSMDLPTPAMYKAADGINRSCVGRYWWDVSKLIISDGQPRFPLLCS